MAGSRQRRPNVSLTVTPQLTALAMVIASLLSIVSFPAAQAPPPAVVTAEIDGIIHPVAAQYARHVISEADAAGAALVVNPAPGSVSDAIVTSSAGG